jgi:hypothetical protein
LRPTLCLSLVLHTHSIQTHTPGTHPHRPSIRYNETQRERQTEKGKGRDTDRQRQRERGTDKDKETARQTERKKTRR